MECRNHAGTPAEGVCSGCAESYCGNCLVTVRGTRYCASCKHLAVTGPGPAVGTLCKDAKDALTMAIFSFFCFGIILGPFAIHRATAARKKIAADPTLRGNGHANAATLLGAIGAAFWLLGVVIKARGSR